MLTLVASLPAHEREDLLERVREIARSHPAFAGAQMLELPYRTDVYWCRRRDRTADGPRAGAVR